MTNAPAATCGACGSAVQGQFCGRCGAPRGGTTCVGCGAPIAEGARFCSSCGREVGPTRLAERAGEDRTPWIIAGAMLAGLLAVLLLMLGRSSPTPTLAAEPGGLSESAGIGDPGIGTAPDISSMSPRERFNRLYNRVMRAAQSGDETTVRRFTPMALMAYAQLDTVDADARYHAALLEVHTGDVAGAAAEADSILERDPGHLFGYIVRGTVARWQKDGKALARAYAGFLEHYRAQMRTGRPEYDEHKRSIDEFHEAAETAGGAPKPGS